MTDSGYSQLGARSARPPPGIPDEIGEIHDFGTASQSGAESLAARASHGRPDTPVNLPRQVLPVGPLFGQFARFYLCRNSERVAHSPNRYLAGQELRSPVRELLLSASAVLTLIGLLLFRKPKRTTCFEIEHPIFNFEDSTAQMSSRHLRTHSAPAISASLATVFMLRAVPFFAAGILSFESPWPSG
jgi:hypothetical protein